MPRKIVGVLSVLGVAVGGVAAYGLYLARPFNPAKEFQIATPSVPKPNAHDVYIEAAAAFQPKPVAQVLDFRADQEQKEDPKKYPPGPKKAWVAQQGRGYSLFQNAQKLPYLFPPLRTISEKTSIDNPEELRELAKFVEVRNQVWAQSGQHEKAAQGALDIWQMGLQAAHGAPLLPATNAQAIEIFARRSLNGEIAHLNGAEAQHVTKRLEDLLSKRVSYSQALRGERASLPFFVPRMRDQAEYDAKQQARDAEAAARGETTFYYDTSPPPRQSGLTRNLADRIMSRKVVKGLDNLIPNADAPWPKRQIAPLPSSESKSMDTKLVGLAEKGRFLFTRTETLGQLYLTRLALHAYRKDEGRYPTTLNELVPRYLSQVPLDPFSDKQTLRYRLDGKRYKLWSIGPDARDDNARPVEDPSPRRPASRYMVKAESSGDFVANINR